MTITIRAKVTCTKNMPEMSGSYVACAAVSDSAGRTTRAVIETAESWPEAMQAAYKLMADLDRELMDEVHASRASRRAQRCECPIGMHSINCHEHERNKHTTEATA